MGDYPKYRSCHNSTYLDPSTLKDHIKSTVEYLRKSDLTYDTIAFCGMSGALIAPPVAVKLGKDLLMVRKDSDDRHSCYHVLGNTETKNYIIVDDLISSGKTLRHIINKIENSDVVSKPILRGILTTQLDGLCDVKVKFRSFDEIYDNNWLSGPIDRDVYKILTRMKKSESCV